MADDLQHEWDVSPNEAMRLQARLRERVIQEDQFGPVTYVAGVDAGYEEEGETTRAAVAVLGFPDLALHEQVVIRRPTSFPYVPGLLSFRESPAVLEALAGLTTRPDVILCDGQGRAHPRRFGIACHIGVLTDTPTIGVGKTRLLGTHDPLANERGAWEPLRDKGEVIGAVLRTRVGTQPLYISVGHRISLESAVALVMACTPKYRLPETTRWAHRLASGLV